MANFHHYRIILMICTFFVEQLVCQNSLFKPTKMRLAKPILNPDGQTLPQTSNLEPNGVNPYGQQTNLLQSLPSRSDNRNPIMDTPVFRSKPKCNKRIRIANGVTRFRDRGSFVRYACSHGFTLLGATIAVCLRDEWSEIPPICVRPGCRRVLTPSNGVARLTYAGAVASFVCQIDHQLEGSRVLYCDGNRWNDTEPVCVPIHPVTTSTEVWEWPQPPTEEIERENENENENELSPDGHGESLDYNTTIPSPTLNSSSNFTPLEENSPPPPIVFHSTTTTTRKSTDIPSTNSVYEKTTTPLPFLNRTTTPNQSVDIDTHTSATTRSGELPSISESTTENLQQSTITPTRREEISSVRPLITISASLPTTQASFIDEVKVIKTTTKKTDEPTPTTTTPASPPPPDAEVKQGQNETEPIPKLEGPTTTENWEPFPDNAFDKFDQELEAGSADTYETKGPEAPTMPEFIQPISPHKLGDDGDHEFYKKWAHVSIVGGIVLGVLGGVSLVGGIATYCWRRKVGIARANEHDQDGRTLSASDANEDFMWMDSSRDHRMSRL